MAVYGKRVRRLDRWLVRGDSNQLGGRWRKLNVPTNEITPVDLSEWSGVAELWSPDGAERWWHGTCGVMSDDGHAVCSIPPAAFAGAEWQSRRHGTWKVTVTSPDKATVRTIGWGYWTLTG
ncbi:hypothetical protein Uis1B_0621 [Bifidobacterium margollesii]|uniref:Uncharacterized protein n=1 Tax=Bifidobacterium margollesii TaxID=2020964 RepID=A0A2N5JBP5_9BIFI|nr:hypothetical protein [Bifidobacterium margollesii]PLS31629.1 hypothetical protein Uis1B_0621 [Bifidobacterium margollesii]